MDGAPAQWGAENGLLLGLLLVMHGGTINFACKIRFSPGSL